MITLNLISKGRLLVTEVEEPVKVFTGGTRMRVWCDEETEDNSFKLMTRSKNGPNSHISTALVDFLVGLQDEVSEHIVGDFLEICTLHQRGDQVFRAHPNYRGKGPWRDWAWVD